MTYQSYGERLESALSALLADLRRESGLSLDAIGDLAGAHRTSVGKIERTERGVSVAMAAQLAKALQRDLSDLICRAEEAIEPRNVRRVSEGGLMNAEALRQHTGLTLDQLAAGIAACYATMDTIDAQLTRRGEPRVARLVELANLSGMLGNLLGAGLAEASAGRFKRNKPHTYPDLLPCVDGASGVELKMALEANKPKGHLAKSGCHITVRYVLVDQLGTYVRGDENRGDVARIWEVRVGNLDAALDFDISNTAGDSGKTAVVKTKTLARMPVVYLDRTAIPYADEVGYLRRSGIELVGNERRRRTRRR